MKITWKDIEELANPIDFSEFIKDPLYVIYSQCGDCDTEFEIKSQDPKERPTRCPQCGSPEVGYKSKEKIQ